MFRPFSFSFLSLALIFSSTSHTQSSSQIQGSKAFLKAEFNAQNSGSRPPCNFLCQEIPKPNEVLKGWGKAAAASLNSPVLRVLAWNVYKGRFDLFKNDFLHLTQNADLVMLSEGTDGSLVKPVLDQKRGFVWGMGISFFMKGDFATGVITGSSAQPRAVTYTRTTELEPFVKSPKVTLIAKYFHQPSNQEILALNIHGINWVNESIFEKQIRSVEPYLKAHRGPIIFAGDFNMKNLARLQIVNRIVGAYGLKRVPWKNPNTEKQLDDAFVRGFEVKSAVLINEVIDRSSDHPALALELVPLKTRR